MKKFTFVLIIFFLLSYLDGYSQGVRNESIIGSTNDTYVYEDGEVKHPKNDEHRVGGADESRDACGVHPFQLPVLAAREVITSASFSVHLNGLGGTPQGHVDMYGLPYRTSSDVLDTDYFRGDFATDPDATAIQDNFASTSSSSGFLTSSSSANDILLEYIINQYNNGAVGGDYIFIRLGNDTDQSKYKYWKFASANTSNKPVLNLVIKDPSVLGVSIDPDGPLTIAPLEEISLTGVVSPEHAENKVVSWNSDAPGVATVDNSGLVKGVSEGSATITVTTDEGSFTDEIDITVQCPNVIPANFTAIKGYTEVTLTWDVVGGAEAYKIYYGTNPGGPYTIEPIADGAANSTIITGLTNGIQYYFKISAISNQSICESDLSAEVSATPSDIYEYENAGIYISTIESGNNLGQGMSAERINGQPTNKNGFGIYIPLDFVVDISAPNAVDNLNACLTYYFDPASVPEGMNLASLALFRFNEQSQAWVKMGGEVTLDGENSYVKLCGINEFSNWTLAGSVPESVPLKNWSIILVFLAVAGFVVFKKF